MLSSAFFTVQDTLKGVPIYLALAFRRLLPGFIHNPMAALPEQVGFLANADDIDSGTKFKEVVINGRSHLPETDTLGTNFVNARVTKVLWRKVRNSAQHEFIVMRLRENREEQPRTSVVIVDRTRGRMRDIFNHLTVCKQIFRVIGESALGTRAGDRFRFSHSGTDAFVKALYPATEIMIEVDFEACDLNLLHIASLAEAIHECYPEYTLLNENCYSFANFLFQGLLSIITAQHPETDFTQIAGNLRRGSKLVVDGKWQGIITARKKLIEEHALPALMARYETKFAAAVQAAREAPSVKLGEVREQRDHALALVAQQKEEIAHLRRQLGGGT